MTLTDRHTRFLIVLLLLVQLSLPLFGSLYISTIVSTGEASHTEMMCVHTDADIYHESQDRHEHIPHCHELDSPYDTVSGTFVKHSPLISPLTALYKGAFLPGYGAPLEIPPKSHV